MEGGIIEADDSTYNRSEDDAPIQGWCHPKRIFYRFTGLLLMCFLGFGSYFCYDNPAALQDKFILDLNMQTSRFVLLYSIYSWPNIIFCFIGGFLLDAIFGIRLGTILYMGLTMTGQAVFALGAYVNTFWLMMFGRFIFGIGAESLAVAQNSYAVMWFKGKELNMVFGLQLSLARVGSTVNFLVMEDIYNYINQYYKGSTCIGLVLFVATMTCVGSTMCALFLAIMDKHKEKILNENINQNSPGVKITDIKDFKGVFWMVASLCVTYYVAIFPFITLGKVFFEWKYNYSPVKANNINSLVYLISAIASPFMGFVVDKTGKNVLWVNIGICITLLAHILLNFSYVNPYMIMVMMGLGYAVLASSLWPLIALVVPEHQLGTAYGIAQALQNLGLAIIAIVAGQIVDYTLGYFWLEMFFIGCLWVCLVIAIIMWIVDNANTGGYLNMTPYQREQYEEFCIMPSNTDTERLLSADTPDFSTANLLQPQSDIHIRNRYLSRIGASVPIHAKCTIVRPLR